MSAGDPDIDTTGEHSPLLPDTPSGDAILYGHGRDEQTEQRREIKRLREQLAERDQQLDDCRQQMQKVAMNLDKLQQQVKEMQYHANRAAKNLQRQERYAAAAEQRGSIAGDDTQQKNIFQRGFFDWLR